MSIAPTLEEISKLFKNNDPEIVWSQARGIVCRIYPEFDFSLVQTAYHDIVALFRGDYPGYCAIKTPYHDLPHSLEVFLCGMRLLHGVHLSGDPLSESEIEQIMIALMMHDIGYAQRHSEENGTGAQFTRTHVQRGIAFMRDYFIQRQLPAESADIIASLIQATDPATPFASIQFRDPRCKMLASIVATADITGQMADRVYLEKLLFLFFEFDEAQYGHFNNAYEMLRSTHRFYLETRKKLDGAYDGIYRKLEWHFQDSLGSKQNFYIESIERNMQYLDEILSHDDATVLRMLKRDGIVAKAQTILKLNVDAANDA